jgi:hypothetical protein
MHTIKLVRGKRLLPSLLAVALAAASLAVSTAEATEVKARPMISKRVDAPEMVLYNGKITTLDARTRPSRPSPSATARSSPPARTTRSRRSHGATPR